MPFRERSPGTPPRDVAQRLNVSVTNIIPLGPRLYENLGRTPTTRASSLLTTVRRKARLNAPAVVSHSLRAIFIKSSILRTMEARPELKFCSMLSPVKKVSNNSARESAFIFGRSTSIFLAMSCFSLLLLRVTIAIASCGNIGTHASS
jgi:hypothetical protein